MAATWEELEQKYGASPAPDASAANDPWAALEKKYSSAEAPNARGYAYSEGSDLNPNDPNRVRIETAGTKGQPKEATTLDRVMAVPAGVNRAGYALLPGLPIDTMLNVADLLKAGVGYTASKLTDKAPPEWTEPFDRKGIPGSSDWISSKINGGAGALGVRSPIDNPAPQDAAARILYSGGLLAGSSIVPNPRASIGALDQVRNIGMGTVGGLANGAVAEVSPEWAGVAGMLPQMGVMAGKAGTKAAIRGGEAGRKNMEQRLQDFKNAGVDAPSVGLASGNRFVQGVENLMSLTPGSVGVFERSKQRMVDGMQGRTNQTRDNISPVYGPAETGAAIQRDLKGAFKDRISNTYGLLNDKVERVVGPNTPVPVTESIFKSGQLTTPLLGAEATSSNFINSRIKKINGDLSADAGGRPAQTINSAILGPNGLPAFQTMIPATAPQGIPFAALKDLRTKIGKESQSNAIMGTPEQADFKQLYGAMSQDMKNGVALADLRNGTLPAAGGSATTALNRANTYYSRAMGKADALNPLANRATPEGAYGSVAKSLDAGPTTYGRVRNAVTPETRKQIVATVIDDMGKAAPGQQGAAGDTWSPRTFLTNYNRMDQQAKAELFRRLPGGKAHAENLADIAKAADMISQGSKVWANPSGTTAALTARGTFGAIGVGAFFQPVIAAGTVGGLIAGNGVSRLLVSPIFANWLAKAPKTMAPAKMQSYAQRLVINAKMSGDSQLQQDVGEYLRSVEETINNSSNAGNK
jgi:hypothetical protein